MVDTAQHIAPERARNRSRRRHAGRRLAMPLALALAGLALGACTADAGPDATGPGTPETTAAAPTSSPGGDAGTTSDAPTAEPATGTATTSPAGCPGGGTVPAGANTGATADLDGDGVQDTLWLSGGDERTLGVATASGAVFSAGFSSGAPQAASALGARLGDGSAIVLLDTGRSVALYAVIDCELVPTANVQGDQYTFDLGFTGYGTGVGCVDLGEGLVLTGLKARPEDEGQSFEVTRTPIELTGHGAAAANGETEVIATGASPDDPVVVTARSVTCGEAEAQVDEPRG